MLITLLSLVGAKVENLVTVIPEPPQDGGIIQMVVMLAIALFFFYVVLWRPEQKRRQEIQNMQNGMKKGDMVVAANLVGQVYDIEERFVVLRMMDGQKIKVLKIAVQEIMQDPSIKTP